MIEPSLFIPEEMMNAPEHPLAKNIELPLPESQASREEIRAIQQRDRIPGVIKRIIPFDTNTYWDYWWCVPGRVLLPEDVELLQRDRARVEAIVAKLVWLWGGLCFGKDTNREQDCDPIYDWQQVLAFVNQKRIKPDFLDIDFLPLAIKPEKRQSDEVTSTEGGSLRGNGDSMPNSSTATHVAVEPNHWHIEFFQLQTTVGGWELQEDKNVCSCQIWTGKPFTKHLATGKATTRYDLWISRPLTLTIPPWQPS